MKLLFSSLKDNNFILIRFWAVQILFVGTPSVIYIIYALPKLKKAAVIHQHKHECEKVAGMCLFIYRVYSVLIYFLLL